MRIKAEHVFPPIPDRRFDWSAVDDATYDGPGCPIGYGATEQEAIADLLDQIEPDPDPSRTALNNLRLHNIPLRSE